MFPAAPGSPSGAREHLHLGPLNVVAHKSHVFFLIVGHLRVSLGELGLSHVITWLVIIHSSDDDLVLIVPSLSLSALLLSWGKASRLEGGPFSLCT